MTMKSNPQPIKCSSSQQLVKSTSAQSGKVRKARSMSPDELLQAQSRKNIISNAPGLSASLLEKFQVSMESSLESNNCTRRKILPDDDDAPANAKRFKTHQGQPGQDVQADDLLKESGIHAFPISSPTLIISESESSTITFEGSEGERSKPYGATLNETGGIYEVERPLFVQSSVSIEEGQSTDEMESEKVQFDANMESNLHAISPISLNCNPESSMSTFEASGGERSKSFEATLNETDGIYGVDRLTLVRSSNSSEESHNVETEKVNSSMSPLIIRFDETLTESVTSELIDMEKSTESVTSELIDIESRSDVDMTLHTSIGQNIRDVGINKTSRDETILAAKTFHDEGNDEELENINLDETELRMPEERNSGQNQLQDDTELSVMTMVLVLIILFLSLSKRLIEAVRSVTPF